VPRSGSSTSPPRPAPQTACPRSAVRSQSPISPSRDAPGVDGRRRALYPRTVRSVKRWQSGGTYESTATYSPVGRLRTSKGTGQGRQSAGRQEGNHRIRRREFRSGALDPRSPLERNRRGSGRTWTAWRQAETPTAGWSMWRNAVTDGHGMCFAAQICRWCTASSAGRRTYMVQNIANRMLGSCTGASPHRSAAQRGHADHRYSEYTPRPSQLRRPGPRTRL
jgi:hypothetical protein